MYQLLQTTMRLNKFIALYTGISRRKADELIEQGEVRVNRTSAHVGMKVTENDSVIVAGSRVKPYKRATLTVLLNKPIGYVCSTDGQGSPSVYDLLQKRMMSLNIAGRLDKDSSGLVVLTNDGQLLQELTHPSYNKIKKYIVTLDQPLSTDEITLLQKGVDIGDERPSKMVVKKLPKDRLEVALQEGRNRQIRRSFEAIGYEVTSLHRIQLAEYTVRNIELKQFIEI